MPQTADEVFIALPPQHLRVERRKGPNLALGEEGIWRSAGTDTSDKSLRPMPHIKAIGMKAERHVKAETRSLLARFPRCRFKLLVRYPLGVDVIASSLVVVIVLPQPA